ncbi:MAG: PaaI family thioesterase [Rhodoblastus sp.]
MTGKTLDPAQAARIRAAFETQGMMQTLGASLTRIEAGEVEIVLPFGPHIAQHHGFVHAGGLTTVVDNAGGFAAMTLMPEGMQVLTVEFKVNFLSPAIGEKFIAIGRVKRAGKQISVVEGEVLAESADGARKPVALMLATMMGVWLKDGSGGA